MVIKARSIEGSHQQVKIVQKIHVIILGAFRASAIVCVARTMKFQNVSPGSFENGHTARSRCSATTATSAEAHGSMKVGSLQLNGTSQSNPLREIAQELTLDRRWAEECRPGELFDGEFPFQIKVYAFSSGHSCSLEDGQNRLALIVPLSGLLRVDIAKCPLDLCAGEILIAPDLNISVKAAIAETHVEVLVISFLPRFVYSLGSPSNDYFFLLPFYANYGLKAPVVREGPSLREIHGIIARLVQRYLDRTSYFEVGCKALFLELLYCITRQFRDAEGLRSEMVFQTARMARLAPVLEFVEGNYPQLITLKEAASLAKMSVPQFVRLFKRVAGMSFVSYLTHVRLSHSLRLLKESSLTIAEVACEVGFSDQSYFDRRFKEAFGQTPRDFRQLRAGRRCESKGSPRRFWLDYHIRQLGTPGADPAAKYMTHQSVAMKKIAAAARCNLKVPLSP
jgi:AraC-like DNA-binding protein